MKQPSKTSFILFLCILIASCKVTTSYYRTPSEQATAVLQDGIDSNERLRLNKMNSSLPKPVQKALIPGPDNELHTGNIKQATSYGKRFDIKVSNISAPLFFKNLGKEATYSIAVDPNVTGTITLDLKNVTIIELFNTLRDMYGYDYEQTSFGFEIMPAKLETRSFHVNYLDIKRDSSSNTQINADQLNPITYDNTGNGQSNTTNPTTPLPTNPTSSPHSEVNTTTQLDFWSELKSALQALVGDENGRSVIVNPSSGAVIVKGYPADIRQVGQFLDQIQSSMSREVVLEVKLLEVQLNDNYNAGINWNILGFQQIAGDTAFPPDGDSIPLTTIDITGRNFSSIIKLLEQQGTIQTIANPRVLTINNQQAVIRIGNDQFFVTGITTNLLNNGGFSTTSTATSATVNLSPFFSGIILDITPQISKNGDILLHLHPIVSDVTQQDKRIDIGASQPMQLPLADSNVREYDSIVRAESGQVILVGGLTQNNVSETISATPFVSKIPFIGTLFRSTVQSSKKTELVILLKPTVVGRSNGSMAKQLPVAEARINELDRGFHFGSLPETFGNEAEEPKYNREIEH